MFCSHPITLWSSKQKCTISVPCGHCINCRITRASAWSDRIQAEIISQHGLFAFCTLTYDDEHVRYTSSGIQTLCKRDLQLFFKRFRQNLSFILPGKKIKYFACGEYGDRTGRPHYHLLIIGVESNAGLRTIVNKSWQLGFVDCQPPLSASASVRYVTSYITKKYNGELGKEVYEDAEPPFQSCSLGIGKKYYYDNLDDIDSGYYKFNGHPLKIPRCYINDFPKMNAQRVITNIDNNLNPSYNGAMRQYRSLKVAQLKDSERHSLVKERELKNG